jgi:imidazoleglycerol-phosphate dehydratase
MPGRKARYVRETKETKASLTLNLDGKGKAELSTPIPFLDHMLDLMVRHGFFDLSLKAQGDTDVDLHHTVEDIGICLGEVFKKALGGFGGIRRYGDSVVPMGEALASVVVDICNRPHLVFTTPLVREKVGKFDVELVKEFFQAFASRSGTTIHIVVHYGDNAHHVIEAVFKAFGRALDEATLKDQRVEGALSTKGIL